MLSANQSCCAVRCVVFALSAKRGSQYLSNQGSFWEKERHGWRAGSFNGEQVIVCWLGEAFHTAPQAPTAVGTSGYFGTRLAQPTLQVYGKEVKSCFFPLS